MNTTLRIAMPMLNYVPGGMGGSETYGRELTRELSRRDDVEIVRYISRTAKASLVPGSSVGERVANKIRGGSSAAARVAAIARAGASRGLARAVSDHADVIHFPFTVPVPSPRGTPFVVTLLDVQHLDMPQFLPHVERGYRRLAYDGAARRASSVITISEFCRSRIVERLDIEPDRVRVIPLAVSTTFAPGQDPTENYILYPARGWPHKNHGRLIAAVELVRHEWPEVRLVLTGDDRAMDDAPDWVEQRGFVTEVELARLYRRARCLAFPSQYEGFGLPVLEAMASGCPVASSRAGALPEVCGNAAVQFDPLDVPGMARAIMTAARARERLVPLGIEQASRFTWEGCASAHVAAYRAVSDSTQR